MNAQDSVTTTVVHATAGDPPCLAELTRLHVGTFPEGLLALLGDRFVDGYYRAIIHDPEGWLCVAWHQGRVVGLLGGTLNRLRFQNEHRIGAAKWRILLEVARLRIAPSAVLRAMRKQKLTRDLGDSTELLILAVSPSMRRHGVGAALLRNWHDRLRAGGEQSYIVFTDSIEGLNFYTKNGGECLFRFDLAGRTSAGFRMRVG